MLAVSLTPLIIVTAVTLYQHRRLFRNEATQPISDLTSNAKRSLEFFLAERRSALTFIINDNTFDELCDPDELARIAANLNRSMAVTAIVDLGLIDSSGSQRCYVGPFRLEGKDYIDQEWFHQAQRRGVYVSDVFLGYRNLPHFAIAISHATPEGLSYMLRATIDAETLREQIGADSSLGSTDIFLVNREGTLQSPSRRFGEVLQPISLAVPPPVSGVEVREQRDENGQEIIVGVASVADSPYVIMVVRRTADVMVSWNRLRTELLVFVAISCALILGVTVWGSNQFVNRLREADHRRAALWHKMEYSNKLASIGRLAAGVSHEINNPLAIINEKAGLLRDLVQRTDDFPNKQKSLEVVESVLRSVARCKTITHRLLGFAKHMDVEHESIDLPSLVREVLGFLEKEASYREISVTIDQEEGLPTISSDRGQLQQVFLNILNNAFAAVSDGGHIEISARRAPNDMVAVAVKDDGVGIPRDRLKEIFEPFFTTKEGFGTGLGLSITYGIVHKLRGRIEVESELGKGTTFTVLLPIGA
jgi:two-component system NtrC family sensor kinase